MMNLVRLLLCVATAAVTCGFTWGFGKGNDCTKARTIITGPPPATAAQRTKEEERVLDLCPEGGPGLLVLALRQERQGNTDEAMADYRQALAADNGLAEAHGNLGLLLLAKGNKNDAAVELTQGLMGRPTPRYHRALASILLEGKMYALARFHYEEAVKAFPADPTIHAGLAESYENLGEDASAEREYRWLLTAGSDREAARRGLARVYLKGKRYDDAMKVLTEAAAAVPGDREIHRLMGDVYRAKGNLPEAEKEYRLAGVAEAISPDDYVREGDRLFLAREYDRAVEAYQHALGMRPRWPDTLGKLGDAFMAAGRDDEAIQAYRQSLDIDGSNSSIHYALGVLYERKGQLDDAVAHYQQALRYDPNNGDPRRRLADIDTLRGQYPEAIDQYKALIAQRDDNPLIHFKLAKVYDRTKQYGEAITEYQAAIKLDPANIEAHKELAMLYARRGMADEAISQFRAVLGLRKDDRDSRNALTALYVKQHRYDDLFQLVKEGVDLTPNDPTSHYKLGIMYDFRKDYPSAIAEFQKAIDLKGTFAKALSAMGKVYLQMGDLTKARQTLEAAKKADPNLVEASELLFNLKDEASAGASERHGRIHHRRKKHHRKKGHHKTTKKHHGKSTKKGKRR